LYTNTYLRFTSTLKCGRQKYDWNSNKYDDRGGLLG